MCELAVVCSMEPAALGCVCVCVELAVVCSMEPEPSSSVFAGVCPIRSGGCCLPGAVPRSHTLEARGCPQPLSGGL